MSEHVIDYSEETRKIYHQQHTRIANDEVAYEDRLVGGEYLEFLRDQSALFL